MGLCARFIFQIAVHGLRIEFRVLFQWTLQLLHSAMDTAYCALHLAVATHNLPLLTTVAAAFAAAWMLGLITQRIGLSPIVGYLLAGVVIGPYTPGFTGDVALAMELAEIGVILLMFGVGLHFHLGDLWRVKAVAVPGAIGQSCIATFAAIGVFQFFGWSVSSSAMLGMAMAVASTVVLLRVLLDRGMLNTSHGHVAVGWLIVEDILTVLLLVLVPVLGTQAVDAASQPATTQASGPSVLASLGAAVLRLAALVVIILLAGSRVVPWILAQVAKLRSAELFTLTVLVLSIAVAVGSAVLFGASVALGAFLAGIVVAQSPLSHQAAADALPMRDAFAVLFFVSVGMLLDPSFLITNPGLVLAGLGVVLIIKPLAALVIVALCGYPVRTALTAAIGLAQIGEFSFILAQVAREYGLMPAEGLNILVAVAMVSITINPLLFRALDPIERWLDQLGWPYRLLNARHARRAARISNLPGDEATEPGQPLALIIGYGPVGRLVDAMLRDAGMTTVIVESNLNSVESLVQSGRKAIYGDGTRREVLEQAGIRKAAHLIVSLPHADARSAVVLASREQNPTVEITVRARYLHERDGLIQAGANKVVFEEGESGIALARHVLERRGMSAQTIEKLLQAVRGIWKMGG